MHTESSSFSREITRHFDSYFEEFDLAVSYVDLILILYDNEEITQNILADYLNLAPSTITRFVNKLLKKGFVEKKKIGRTALITLSGKGHSVAPKLKSYHEKAIADLREKLGEKYVHTTKQLLQHGTTLLKD